MYVTSSLRQSGLTLIESLIVVILLGIVAAAAVPRFSFTAKPPIHKTQPHHASNALQHAIQLYAAEHNGVYPGHVRHTDGIRTTTADEAKAAFEAQLLHYSNMSGQTSPTKKPGFPLGPYLPHGIPSDPSVSQSSDIQVVFENPQIASGEQRGWRVVVPSRQVFPIPPLP